MELGCLKRMEGSVGIELPGALRARKLLILRNGKSEKNNKSARARYTRRTRTECPLGIAARIHVLKILKDRGRNECQIVDVLGITQRDV